MTLIRCQASRPIAIARILDMVGVPVRVGMAADNRLGRMLDAVRGERPGMQTGQDHREEAEKGDEQTHAGLVSRTNAVWIGRMDQNHN